MHPTHQNPADGARRRGEVTSPDGLGNPTPTDSISLFPASSVPLRLCVKYSSRVALSHVAPLGLKIFVYTVCYKHVAPLGLNTSTHQNSRHGIHRRGLVSSPDGLGNPTPTHPILLRVFNPVHLPLIASIRRLTESLSPEYPNSDKWHMSPLWGFGVFGVCRVCYKHAAPLGLNAEPNPAAPSTLVTAW